MTSGIDNSNDIRSGHNNLCCGGSTSGGKFCGLMLVIIGAIWIGKKTGLIPFDMDLFWPTVMVITGVWILAGAFLRRKKAS